MKEEYKDFVGIYDESVSVDLCDMFVKNYEVAKKNETIIKIPASNFGFDIDIFRLGSI